MLHQRGEFMLINKIKTVLLLTILSCLFMALGIILGGKEGLQVAFLCSLLMNGLVYFFSESLILKIYNAKPLDKYTHAPIYTMVEELTQTMHIPMPKMWLIATPMANAFATGRNPNHASVAITTGIIDILAPDELRGVLAHELAHIKNRDILIATIAATIATSIGYIANMAHHVIFWGSFFQNNQKKRGNPLFMLIVAICMPIAATLIQLAISRSREYLADETGAHYSRDPLALASALEKLHNNMPYAHLHEDTQRASTAPLFIVHPFTKQHLLSLFSTHPPIHKRITRLREMYEKMF